MKTISTVAMASVIALSAAAFSVIPEAAKAGPIVSPGHYRMSYDLGGTDCSFTSYAQCEATASGQAAVCYGNGFHGDEGFQSRRGGDYHEFLGITH